MLCEIKYDDAWDDIVVIGMDTESGKTVEVREPIDAFIASLNGCLKRHTLPFVIISKEQKVNKPDGVHKTVTPSGVTIVEKIVDGKIVSSSRSSGGVKKVKLQVRRSEKED